MLHKATKRDNFSEKFQTAFDFGLKVRKDDILHWSEERNWRKTLRSQCQWKVPLQQSYGTGEEKPKAGEKGEQIEKKEKGEPSPLAEEVKAKELRQQQLEELENEEPSKVVVAEDAPLEPGGLSPQEDFDSLPEKMQECFASQDIPLLQKVVEEMPQEEAAYHMKRCIDSGLWVP